MGEWVLSIFEEKAYINYKMCGSYSHHVRIAYFLCKLIKNREFFVRADMVKKKADFYNIDMLFGENGISASPE